MKEKERWERENLVFDLGFLQGNHYSKKWKALPVPNLHFHLIHRYKRTMNLSWIKEAGFEAWIPYFGR